MHLEREESMNSATLPRPMLSEPNHPKPIPSEPNHPRPERLKPGSKRLKHKATSFLKLARNKIKPAPNFVPTASGLVVGYEKLSKTKEKVYIVGTDVHSLILGATRSGKTRCLILQSLGLMAMLGDSMILSDPKGEIYDCIGPYLRELGYTVSCINFKDPKKSQRYNILQLIIDAMDYGDIPKAIELTWDITSSLVPTGRGEPIWENGEASVIAGAIMAVVYDNRHKNKRQYQNMTNVYYFINTMCKAGEKGIMPLDKYVAEKDSSHPAAQLFAVALLAPSRTRGSFFTAALTKLRLFTSPYIYNMTHTSDFALADVGNGKHAVFIILPDGKETYNSLASIFVFQQYHALLEKADKMGGRLKTRVNFMLEEFGNFTKIPGFTQMITVAGGRGIRFNLVLQSFEQLDDVYGKEKASVVKDNCDCLIYLRSPNPNTNADISRRLGKYTTSSYSRSNSTTTKRSTQSNASMNLIARDLLTADEVCKIERPYALVMLSGHPPAITTLPDISKWSFNTIFGMGDIDHNARMRVHRNSLAQPAPQKEIEYWEDLKALYVYSRPLLHEEANGHGAADGMQVGAGYEGVHGDAGYGGAHGSTHEGNVNRGGFNNDFDLEDFPGDDYNSGPGDEGQDDIIGAIADIAVVGEGDVADYADDVADDGYWEEDGSGDYSGGGDGRWAAPGIDDGSESEEGADSDDSAAGKGSHAATAAANRPVHTSERALREMLERGDAY